MNFSFLASKLSLRLLYYSDKISYKDRFHLSGGRGEQVYDPLVAESGLSFSARELK